MTGANTHATSREIAAPIDQVFAAFGDPVRLARWWGPAGFSNSFDVCEFRKGGRWKFVMIGPDGHKYPNESVFAELEPPGKVVVQHLSNPQYVLTILLTPAGAGTRVSWSQAFETERVAQRLKDIIIPANEQNLDRLTAEVLGRS